MSVMRKLQADKSIQSCSCDKNILPEGVMMAVNGKPLAFQTISSRFYHEVLKGFTSSAWLNIS
jgi:hypothetical protein